MSDPILDNIAKKQANDAAKKLSLKMGELAKFVEARLASIFRITGSKSDNSEKPLFAVLVFADGNLQYASNCDRQTIKQMMATLVVRWDENEIHKPLHQKTDEELDKERENPL
jgi:hypothetical protein